MGRIPYLFGASLLAGAFLPACGGADPDGPTVVKVGTQESRKEYWTGLEHLRPIVQTPPPGDREDIKRPPPTKAHVWVPGFWGWDGDHFAWRPGRWEVPPSPYTVWIAPEWKSVKGGYRFRPGNWLWETP